MSRTRLQAAIGAIALVAGFAAFSVGLAAWAQQSIAPAPEASAAPSNVYLGGSAVQTVEPVGGDLFASGGRVSVSHDVQHDAMLAGGDVQVRSHIGQDLRAAGGQVALSGEVAGDTMLAGGNVEVTADARLGGRTWLAGGNIVLAGTAARDVKAYGGKVTISGEVGSDLRVVAEELVLAPTAIVRGNLHYVTRRPARIEPQAQVLGRITHEPAPPREEPVPQRRSPAGTAWTGLTGWLGLIVAGALWVLLCPAVSARARTRLSAQPWLALGVGLLVLLAVPPLAVMLLITVVGIPLAVLLLAATALLALAGGLTAADALGEAAFRAAWHERELTAGRRAAVLAPALAAFALVGALPVVGPLVVFGLWVAGMGSIVLARVSKAAPPAPTAPVPTQASNAPPHAPQGLTTQ